MSALSTASSFTKFGKQVWGKLTFYCNFAEFPVSKAAVSPLHRQLQRIEIALDGPGGIF